MAKPICVINIDAQYLDESGPISTKTIRSVQKTFEEKFNDYHVLVVPVQNLDRTVELQVYHEKDFTEIQHAELLKRISDSLVTLPIRDEIKNLDLYNH